MAVMRLEGPFYAPKSHSSAGAANDPMEGIPPGRLTVIDAIIRRRK